MLKTYRHTGIIVSNLKKSSFFYEKLLKLKRVSRIVESGDYFNKLTNTKKLKADVLKVKSKDNIIIEIIYYINRRSSNKKKPNNMINVGTMHMCFTVSNINRMYQNMKKMGLNFFPTPFKISVRSRVNLFLLRSRFKLSTIGRGCPSKI